MVEAIKADPSIMNCGQSGSSTSGRLQSCWSMSQLYNTIPPYTECPLGLNYLSGGGKIKTDRLRLKIPISG